MSNSTIEQSGDIRGQDFSTRDVIAIIFFLGAFTFILGWVLWVATIIHPGLSRSIKCCGCCFTSPRSTNNIGTGTRLSNFLPETVQERLSYIDSLLDVYDWSNANPDQNSTTHMARTSHTSGIIVDDTIKSSDQTGNTLETMRIGSCGLETIIEEREDDEDASMEDVEIGGASSSTQHVVPTDHDFSTTKECCPICLTHFKPNDLVCASNNEACPHVFHARCMFPWLLKQYTCPVCRQNYLTTSSPEG